MTDDFDTTNKIQERKDYVEGMTKYYKLKSKYEEKKEEEKRNIAKMPNKSWREKRRLYKAWQTKCIHCGALGGTLFNEGFDEELGERRLVAICGNRVDPCSLSIEVHLGSFLQMEETLREDEEIKEEYKNQLVRDKNDLIFGYINTEEALEKFDVIKTKLVELTEVHEYELMRYYEKKGEDSQTQKKIKTLEEVIYQDISTMKTMLEDYERSQNTVFIQDAVTFYNEELNEKVIELREMKYAACFVDYNEDDNTYHLIQKKYTTETMEENFGKNLGVKKMVLTRREREKTETTKKRKLQQTQNKTRKIRAEPIVPVFSPSSTMTQEEETNESETETATNVEETENI